jgi:hypothetical protein
MNEKHVSLIVYMSCSGCNDKMWNFIQTQTWYGQVEIFYTLEKFYRRLTLAGSSNAVTVLLLSSRQELENLVQYADLFDDQKIILVLPDHAKETVAMGHALYPRFISYSDGDLADVAGVLRKLISHNQAQQATIDHQGEYYGRSNPEGFA